MAQKKKIRIGILGSSGRMGKQLRALLSAQPHKNDFELTYSSAGPHCPDFYSLEHLPRTRQPEVMIDFSSPTSSLAMASLCARKKIPMLVCTTGFSARELRTLSRTLRSVPWMRAPNTSVGVHLMKELARALARWLPPGFQLAITETHHKNKKDAPSGTALALRDSIARGNSGLRVPITSLRKGDVVGVHSLIVHGQAEELTLTHRALHRSLFAHGALRLARVLARRPWTPGQRPQYNEISLPV